MNSAAHAWPGETTAVVFPVIEALRSYAVAHGGLAIVSTAYVSERRNTSRIVQLYM